MKNKYLVLGLQALASLIFTTASFAIEPADENAEQQKYVVDAETSYIHIYTGVAGLMKSLSHKHLVAIRHLEGEVVWGIEQPRAYLEFYPADFLVDDDIERSRAVDEDFRHPVANWIKTGTKKNMLSRSLLNVDFHPKISVDIEMLNPQTPDQTFESIETQFSVSIDLKGHTQELILPATLSISEDQVQITGDFELDHADIGLKPFSAPGGLSKVADSLRFQFEINAITATDASTTN